MKSIINNCTIVKFTTENLKKALRNDFITLSEISNNKRHFKYLLEYLGKGDEVTSPGLNAGMMVIESKYTSRSYLEDYQEHYFVSYSRYERSCERIHFFSHEVDSEISLNKEKQRELLNLMLSNSPESTEIWDKYLGYIVKRPIPTGIIGATLLKTYPEKSDNIYQRKFTATKPYKINVFGREIILKTLIYVEQDRIVGACATSALYVAFHRLSHLFNTKRPNQKKISDAAGISFISPNRKLMNKDGLSTFQICKVIEHYGLEPEIYSLKKRKSEEIKGILYAYLKMGLPIILGFRFNEIKKVDANNLNEEDHAITITGYTEIEDSNIKFESYTKCTITSTLEKIKKKQQLPLILKSRKIIQFYAHDDQIGPFSRIIFENDKIITSWWDKEKGVESKLTGQPFVSIIPLSDRIRMPYETVRENVEIINIWLHTIIDELDYITWDIYLSRSNKEKKNILSSTEFDFELHSDSLSSNLPKYVWIADCHLPGMKLFKVVLDASDINQKFFAKRIIFYSKDFISILTNYFNDVLNQESINKSDKYILEVIETTGLEITNLFRSSLNLKELKLDH